jgi:hypothetical protein
LMEDKNSLIGVIDRVILEPYLQEYTTATESRIVLSNLQKTARKEEIYRQTAGDIFSRPEERQRMRRRMEEMGYFLWEKGRQNEARACAAAALELETAPGSQMLAPDQLLIAMVRHSLEFHRYFDLEEEKKEHPLLIRPSWLREEEQESKLRND